MTSQTPPSKKSESRFDESPMVSRIYQESIPQASYEQWKKEKARRLSLIKKPASSLADMDSPTKKRHGIGYLCENLESWVTQLNQPTVHAPGQAVITILPSLDQVLALSGPTVSIAMQYNRDGLTWRSDVRTCVLQDKKNVQWTNVVIHLPNDGFFYVEESLATNCDNDRHRNSCFEGWAYLDSEIWPKLARFENFARDWFGYDSSKKLQRQIMYNDIANRLDVSFRCPEFYVGIDFVFEPGYPVPEVPENFWF